MNNQPEEKTQPKPPAPTPEQIRQRAHQIYLARGRENGRELDDWLQAEREYLAELEHPAQSPGLPPP